MKQNKKRERKRKTKGKTEQKTGDALNGPAHQLQGGTRRFVSSVVRGAQKLPCAGAATGTIVRRSREGPARVTTAANHAISLGRDYGATAAQQDLDAAVFLLSFACMQLMALL